MDAIKKITKNNPFAPSSLDPFKQPSFWRPEKNNKIIHFQTNTEFKEPKTITKKQIELVTKQFENSYNYSIEAGFD